MSGPRKLSPYLYERGGETLVSEENGLFSPIWVIAPFNRVAL